jgi:hypothetical protein
MIVKAIDKNRTIVDKSAWKEDISRYNAGRCQTLRSSVELDFYHSLVIMFQPNLTLFTMIHDPNFFILGSNPRTMPHIISTQDQGFGSQVMYLGTSKHIKMNLPHRPCQESSSYSLTGWQTWKTIHIQTMCKNNSCKTQAGLMVLTKVVIMSFCVKF